MELPRALTKYGAELNVDSLHHYALRPEVVSRGGAVAVAGLALVPLAAFAARQRWAAYVLGGTLAVLTIELFAVGVPALRRRCLGLPGAAPAGFTPIAFALAGGTAVLTGMIGALVLPAALAAGIVLQIEYPGDFGPFEQGGPAWATWLALIGGAIAVVVGLRRERRVERGARSSPARFSSSACPSRCTAFGTGACASRDSHALTPGLLHALETKVPKRAVVFSDLETSYRIAALRPRLRRRGTACARRRHSGESPVRPPLLGESLLQNRRRRHPRPVPRGLARGGQAALRRAPALAARLRGRALRALPSPLESAPVKVLLVTMYFPPAGGGGVQRPLKFATHLPAHGIETHVLAPDDPKWIHSDPDLVPPTQAWIHRARYLGPRARKLADELHGRQGLDRLSRQARSLSRRVLVPDENVELEPDRDSGAVRIARNEDIDVVITTSPPNSVHLVGAAVKRLTGARWVADLRDSVGAHPHRRVESASVRAKEKVSESVARLVARQADVIVAASEAIAEEARQLEPAGVVTTILNGADFDDFAGLEYHRGDRFRITHTGSFFGKRDPRPFLTALAESGLDDVVARFVGDFRVADREWAETLGLGDRLELHPYVPRRDSLAAPARLRCVAAADPGRRRPRPGCALREGLRVPRGGAAHPGRRAAGRRGGGSDP